MLVLSTVPLWCAYSHRSYQWLNCLTDLRLKARLASACNRYEASVGELTVALMVRLGRSVQLTEAASVEIWHLVGKYEPGSDHPGMVVCLPI